MKGRVAAVSRVVTLVLVASIALAASAKDAWIVTKAKVKLLTADDLSVSAVHVDSADGNVTLHGKVKTAAEKARAEAIVKNLDGVRGVKNLLQVVPDAFKEATKVADAAVKDKVQAMLKSDAALDGIKVASVNNGVVLLTGKTSSADNELRVIEAVRSVAGVRRVASEIQVEPKTR
jgi:hyperosmotically inducible periplasmic protein